MAAALPAPQELLARRAAQCEALRCRQLRAASRAPRRGATRRAGSCCRRAPTRQKRKRRVGGGCCSRRWLLLEALAEARRGAPRGAPRGARRGARAVREQQRSQPANLDERRADRGPTKRTWRRRNDDDVQGDRVSRIYFSDSTLSA